MLDQQEHDYREKGWRDGRDVIVAERQDIIINTKDERIPNGGRRMYEHWQQKLEASRADFGYQSGERILRCCLEASTLGIPTLRDLEAPNFDELNQKLEQINKSMAGIDQYGVGPTIDTQVTDGIHLEKTHVLYKKMPVVQGKIVHFEEALLRTESDEEDCDCLQIEAFRAKQLAKRTKDRQRRKQR